MSDTRSRAGVGAAAADEFRLRYGHHPDECLHYLPAPIDGAPVMVLLGNGECHPAAIDIVWQVAQQATAAGFAFAVVHTSPRSVTDAEVLADQARRGVGWVFEHTEMGHAVDQVVVTGHGSGARLAATVAGHDTRPCGFVLVSGTYERSPIAPSDATCVVAWAEGDTPEVQRHGQEWAMRWTMSYWNRNAVPVHATGRDHDDVVLDLFDAATPLGAAVRDAVSRTRTT